MTLHKAIEKLLLQAGRAMSAKEIAAALNNNRWYVKADSSPITPGQISARAAKYPDLLKCQSDHISLQNANKVEAPAPPAAHRQTNAKIAGKDEAYVLDLCDAILGEMSLRQHRFDFLRGDSGQTLPVDGYFDRKNLVVEYCERQHSEKVPFFDKPERLTVSGVSRAEQRSIYDERRKIVLKEHKIGFAILSYSDFTFSSSKRIIRDKEADMVVIRKILSKWL